MQKESASDCKMTMTTASFVFFGCLVLLNNIFVAESIACQVLTWPSSFEAIVDNPASAGLNLPATTHTGDLYCKWGGFKACYGDADLKTHIKANFVSEGKPYKNPHFNGVDESVLEINGCRASSIQHAIKTITCYDAATNDPISDLTDIEASTSEPIACTTANPISLSGTDIDAASDVIENLFDGGNAVITTIQH